VNRLHSYFEALNRAVVRLAAALLRGFDATVGRLPVPLRLVALCAVTGLLMFWVGVAGESSYFRWAALSPLYTQTLARVGHHTAFRLLGWVAWMAAALAFASCACTFVRTSWSMRVLQAAVLGGMITWAGLIWLVVDGTRLLHLHHAIEFHRFMRNEVWLASIALWLPGALWFSGILLATALHSTRAWFLGSDTAAPGLADRIAANLRSGGPAPEYRNSMWWSGALHVILILLIPLLIRGCGWEAPYAVPEGDGKPAVLSQIRMIRKKVEREKVILSLNTEILFYKPDPDESDVLKMAMLETEHAYVAEGLRGQTGEGKGTRSGWPKGMPGRVRFIRLEYNGGDWDQDLAMGADYNMLLKFKEYTGFKIARNTEHRRINRLRFFPKGKAPPFVFLTGKGGVQLSGHEIKILREYCIKEGGMVFADNGGGSFNAGFSGAMQRVFPGKRWINIGNDDPLFQYPFAFPNGAPPLWHHSGRRAMGLKHDGRWIVFYHQGDLNDAWKRGHSGIGEGLANQAYKLGVNVMYYSFSHYLAHHHGTRSDG